MSRIYFRSPSGTAELRGSERAHMGCLVTDIATGIFDAQGYDRERLFALTHLKQEDYTSIGWGQRFASDFNLWLAVGCPDHFTKNGERYEKFNVVLNTALAIGSDALFLMARLHGQCEIHAWVDGPNRDWLAGVIERGRAAGIMRRDQGWEKVVEFLRSRSDEPVVTSYSVCDGFPNASIAGWVDGHDGDDFWDLPEEERWRLAFAGLTSNEGGPEMRPDRWTFPEYYFTHGETAFSLLDYFPVEAPNPNFSVAP